MYKINYNNDIKKFELVDVGYTDKHFYLADYAVCFMKYKRYTMEFLITTNVFIYYRVLSKGY